MQSNLPYERVDVSSLKFDLKNARKHDKKNIDAIKASLQKFGQRKPIVVLTDNTVIAGNGTLQAAIELGWKTIDVSRTNMSYDEAMAYALADNRSAELATWDNDNLGSILSELDSLQWDIESLGWNAEELDKLIHTGDNIESEMGQITGSKELSEDDFSEFEHKCPKCGFEFDGKK